jgi:adenylyl-sulfate kinase
VQKETFTEAHLISRDERAKRYGHRGTVIWLTGLPAAGKSTLAMGLERELFARGYVTYVLDGDNIRVGLCRDLAFSPEDRHENIRRAGEVAALFADSGAILIASFISPFRRDREVARRAAGAAFHEIYVKADLATCEARDPKGLYRRARAGEIREFTGVSSAYEPPERPELTVDTANCSREESLGRLLAYVLRAAGGA